MACASQVWLLPVCLVACLCHAGAAPLALRRSKVPTARASAEAFAITEVDKVLAGDALSFLQASGVHIATSAGSATNSSLPDSVKVSVDSSPTGAARSKPRPTIVAFAAAPPVSASFASSLRSTDSQSSSNISAEGLRAVSSYDNHIAPAKKISQGPDALSGLELTALNSSVADVLHVDLKVDAAAGEMSPSPQSKVLDAPTKDSVEPPARAVETVDPEVSNDANITLATVDSLKTSVFSNTTVSLTNSTATASVIVANRNLGNSDWPPIDNNGSLSTLSNATAFLRASNANSTDMQRSSGETSNASSGRVDPAFSQDGIITNRTVSSLASTRRQPWEMPDEPVGSMGSPRPSLEDVTCVAVLVTGVSSRYVHTPVLEHIVQPAASAGYPVDYYVRLVRRDHSQRASNIGDAADNPFFSNMTEEQLIATVTDAAKQYGARNVSITILDEKEQIQKPPTNLARHFAYPEDVSDNVVRKFESLEWLWNQTKMSGNNYSQIVVARDDTVLLADVNLTQLSDSSRVYVPYCGKNSARYRPNDNVRVIGAHAAAKVMPLYSEWETDPDKHLSSSQYAELFLKDVMEAKGVAYEESDSLSFFNGAFVHLGGSKKSPTMCAQKPCNARGLPLGVPTCLDPTENKDAASL